MLENWRECKLGDVGSVVTGKTPSSKNPEDWGFQMPFVTPSDYKNYAKFALSSERSLSNEGILKLRNKILPENSVMVTCIGSDMGKVAMNKIPVITNQQINSLIPNSEIIDSNFLYYRLVSLYEILRVYGSDGTAIPIINKNDFANLDISLPPLQEQKAIAEILSSLDDKIDLLHRQNHTLESIAQTLFRQWFIQEAQPDWEEVKLGDYLIPKKGKNITKTQAIEGDYPVVAGGLEPSCYHNQSNTKSPVITISASGANAGFIRLYHTPVWASDCSYIDETITKYVYFFYVFLKYNQKNLTDKQEGSAQPHIYPSHIMNLDILDYPINLIKEFENQAKDIFEKTRKNQKQIQTLENLRDTLLPKLISGEVRIKI